MNHKLVVLLEDGRRLKGTAEVFDPEKPFLLLRRIDVEGHILGFLDIEMKDVVAAFFVRDLALNRTSRQTANDPQTDAEFPDPSGATTIRLRFSWGEVLDGVVYDYDPAADWFFLFPVGMLNRASNNQRVFVTKKALAATEVLTAPAV
jgi:small nuclear ribonucleoprotein (snRNP)-like protein